MMFENFAKSSSWPWPSSTAQAS